MKTDAQVQFDVEQELKWDAGVTHERIGVAVSDGVVTLSGTIPNFDQKTAALKAAQRVAGIKAVVEKLEIHLPGFYQRDDEDIAKTIAHTLLWNVQVPAEAIKVTVEKGWVQLSGQVEWEFQRKAAETAVRKLPGVKGITNLLELKPKEIHAFEIQDNIEKALKRAAEREASRIRVEVQGNRVILSGQVQSFRELRTVRGAAWNAPGVTVVDDSNVTIAAA